MCALRFFVKVDMTTLEKANDWSLVATSPKEIEEIRSRCRALVRRRAARSAGVAAIPLPLFDVAVDAKLLTSLIDDINTQFGLTSEQISQMQPKSKMFPLQAMAGVGSAYIGRLATRHLVTQMLKRTGAKIVTKNVARIVPIAGQLVSAAIGFTAFRSLGYEHIDTCVKIATQLASTDAYRGA